LLERLIGHAATARFPGDDAIAHSHAVRAGESLIIASRKK
jgi:hypothetical protein